MIFRVLNDYSHLFCRLDRVSDASSGRVAVTANKLAATDSVGRLEPKMKYWTENLNYDFSRHQIARQFPVLSAMTSNYRLSYMLLLWRRPTSSRP